MDIDKIIDKVWSFGFGGMTQSELKYLTTFCSNKNILELGSEIGQSAYVMASIADKVTCVDAWDDTYEHLNNDLKQKEVYLNDQKY